MRPTVRVRVYCSHRIRADQAPSYGGPYVDPPRRPRRNPERIGLTWARRQPDGGWCCDECGAQVPVAW